MHARAAILITEHAEKVKLQRLERLSDWCSRTLHVFSFIQQESYERNLQVVEKKSSEFRVLTNRLNALLNSCMRDVAKKQSIFTNITKICQVKVQKYRKVSTHKNIISKSVDYWFTERCAQTIFQLQVLPYWIMPVRDRGSRKSFLYALYYPPYLIVE